MSTSGKKQNLENILTTRRIPVEMHCELGENTESKLKELRSQCVEENTITEHFYDTESFLLASTQTWLSQKDGQWRLILEQSQDGNESDKSYQLSVTYTGNDKNKMPDNPSSLTRAGNQDNVEITQVRALQHESLTEVSRAAFKGQDEDSCSSAFAAVPRYTELTDHSSIIKRIARSLPDALIPREIQHLSIESFLAAAGIQMYDSWIRSRRVKYSLPSGCSLVVETNFTIPSTAPSAVLSMSANVLNINIELETMERYTFLAALPGVVLIQPQPQSILHKIFVLSHLKHHA
ncbi:uncharacterized protein si:dkey-191c17.2 [Hoplias malabaricus]|uniref:uncharacterized protein si:dkey-191c17.2 n=1 Tax=Hoplias malabaricus TaxID=27720 RepID=UPI0034622AA1